MSNILQETWFVGYFIFDPTNASTQPSAPTMPTPPTFYAGITGTANVGPNMTCHWYSGSNIEDAEIEWIVNGNVVGTDADLYYAAGGSYTLQVHYWNPHSGAHAWASKQITVVENMEQCWDE